MHENPSPSPLLLLEDAAPLLKAVETISTFLPPPPPPPPQPAPVHVSGVHAREMGEEELEEEEKEEEDEEESLLRIGKTREEWMELLKALRSAARMVADLLQEDVEALTLHDSAGAGVGDNGVSAGANGAAASGGDRNGNGDGAEDKNGEDVVGDEEQEGQDGGSPAAPSGPAAGASASAGKTSAAARGGGAEASGGGAAGPMATAKRHSGHGKEGRASRKEAKMGSAGQDPPSEDAPRACLVCGGTCHGDHTNCPACYSCLWKDARRVVEICARRLSRSWFTGEKETDLRTFAHEALSVGRPCATGLKCPPSNYSHTSPPASRCTRCRTQACIKLIPDLAFRLLESAYHSSVNDAFAKAQFYNSGPSMTGPPNDAPSAPMPAPAAPKLSKKKSRSDGAASAVGSTRGASAEVTVPKSKTSKASRKKTASTDSDHAAGFHVQSGQGTGAEGEAAASASLSALPVLIPVRQPPPSAPENLSSSSLSASPASFPMYHAPPPHMYGLPMPMQPLPGFTGFNGAPTVLYPSGMMCGPGMLPPQFCPAPFQVMRTGDPGQDAQQGQAFALQYPWAASGGGMGLATMGAGMPGAVSSSAGSTSVQGATQHQLPASSSAQQFVYIGDPSGVPRLVALQSPSSTGPSATGHNDAQGNASTGSEE